MNRFVLVLLIAFSSCCGCSRAPAIVPISGQVLIDGVPLTTGLITIYVEGYRGVVSSLDKDGRFILTTKVPGDGCPVGEHTITVQSMEVLPNETIKHWIPGKYAQQKTSELKVKIDQPNDNLIINLTWKGDPHGKPYIEK
jgi:hypothetical protein